MNRALGAAAFALLAAGCLGPARRAPAPVSVPAAAGAEAVSSSSFTVVCAGDVMLAHRLGPVIRERGVAYPFAGVEPLLSGADVLFFNLEVPVGTISTPFPKKYNFLMSPASMAALTRLKPRLVAGLANNHVLDQGPGALSETFLALDHQGIARCGAGRDEAEARAPAWVAVNGSSVAFLAYSHTQPEEFYAGARRPGTAFAEEKAVRRDVAAAKAAGGKVVVAFHWGGEYDPRVYPHQVRLARAAVDAGADLVVGHHAHTIQGSEVYKGKPIAYGLGNFVFGTANPKAKGGVLRAVFRGEALSLELVPVDVNNLRTSFQTRPFEGDAAEEALREVSELSPSIPWRRKDGRLVWP